MSKKTKAHIVRHTWKSGVAEDCSYTIQVFDERGKIIFEEPHFHEDDSKATEIIQRRFGDIPIEVVSAT